MTLKPVKTVPCGFVSRPHFPISKLVLSESYDTYISRSFQVTREILAECKNQGKGPKAAPLSEPAATTFPSPLWNGLCALKFSLKLTAGVHKGYGKLTVSLECETLFSASFTQETRS